MYRREYKDFIKIRAGLPPNPLKGEYVAIFPADIAIFIKSCNGRPARGGQTQGHAPTYLVLNNAYYRLSWNLSLFVADKTIV